MSIDINYCDTFLSALSKSYTSGDYVRTFGFASVGDGGAATYKVVFGAPSGAKSYTVAGSSFNYADGKFYTSSSSVFQLIPQGNKVYAEQFGVMPENENYYKSNTSMLNRAVSYASDHGVRLEFATKGTYYLNSNICLKSNLFIDGNGAVLVQHTDAPNGTGMFCTEKIDNVYVARKNITINNITLIGRTNENQNLADQAFHVCIEGFTLRNVNIKNFNYAVHTFGRSAAEYTVPDIPNKNWLIENCVIKDTVMGLCCSELDGIVIKDSSITGIFNPPEPDPETGKVDNQDGVHNLYFSSNCLNIRVTNTTLGIVTGDAIHKQFAAVAGSSCADISKNHFYTDIAIDNCDSALCISQISENVMCDNVFATQAMLLVEVSAADNVIISNSNLSQTRRRLEGAEDIGGQGFLRAKDASKVWMQNCNVFYVDKHRIGASGGSDTYYYNMCVNENIPVNITIADNGEINSITKKHRRSYIGENFDIPNHWFKFTGCEFKTTNPNDYYFSEAYDAPKTVYHEYWDNCKLTYSAAKDFFRLKCINSIPAGITIRNSYLKYDTTATDIGAPFRFQCGQKNCNCLTENTCSKKQLGKRFPFVHYENNVLDKFLEDRPTSSWNYHINTYKKDEHNFTIPEAVAISGSYVSGVYRLKDGNFSEMSNLM